MKTEKLIPFDSNIALKHPERVRDADGNGPWLPCGKEVAA